MKKIYFVFVLAIMLFINYSVNSQSTSGSSVSRNGYRIHSMYVGALFSGPVAGLKDLTPDVGVGFKFGSIFYFYKPGIANGLLNFGLQTQWLNAEENIPLFRLDDDHVPYSFAGAANLGPVITLNPIGALYLDLYYMLGTGARLFPNQDEYIYGSFSHPAEPHTRFSQAVGLNFRYKALYTNAGLQMLSFPYDYYNKNGHYTSRSKFTTVQLTIGVCGWRVE